MELKASDAKNISYEALITAYSSDKAPIVILDARSEAGLLILKNRHGEMDFDGFHHAYMKDQDQLLLVPLWEWAE